MSVEAKLAAWFGAAILVLSILAAVFGFKEVQFSSNSFEQIGTLLLTLILVALVIRTSRRGVRGKALRRGEAPSSASADAGRGQAGEGGDDACRGTGAQAGGSSRQPTQEDQDYMNQLVKDVHDAHSTVDEADEQTWLPLSKLRASKVRAASVLSVVAGALVSVSGVRVLGQFVPMENGEVVGALAESALQLDIFRTTDALLTALVLAGGADGIHKMLSRFKAFRSPV